MLSLRVGNEYDRDDVLRRLVDMQYHRTGTLNVARSVCGEVGKFCPVNFAEKAIRVEFFGD